MTNIDYTILPLLVVYGIIHTCAKCQRESQRFTDAKLVFSDSRFKHDSYVMMWNIYALRSQNSMNLTETVNCNTRFYFSIEDCKIYNKLRFKPNHYIQELPIEFIILFCTVSLYSNKTLPRVRILFMMPSSMYLGTTTF